jgi:ParB family chromosome partitioning protein
MKAADQLMARLGGNMAESMGAAAPPAAAPPAAPLHGEAQRYKGASRLRDALVIKVELIAPDPNQPRKEFDPETIAGLAESLKARGQLQPIRVRWDEGLSRWVVISGERRYRAAIQAGLATLTCVEASGALTEDEILEDQLVENCLREDLKPVEQARAFKTLMDRRGWSYRQLGAALNLSSGHITRAVALLELPDDLQLQVEAGALAPSVAYEVSRLDDADRQREVASRVVDEGLSRTEAVEVVRRTAGGKAKGKGRGAGKGRKVTTRVFRKVAGLTVTFESLRGVDAKSILAALAEIKARVEMEVGDGQAAA